MSRERIMLTQAIPAVQQLRRVQGFDPLRFLKRNANGGIELEPRYQRLWFRLACPDGKMLLNRLQITDQIAVYEAQVFLSREDNQPITNFTAAVEKAQAPAGRYVQAAQDEALKTALDNAGFGIQLCEITPSATVDAQADGKQEVATGTVNRQETAPAVNRAAAPQREASVGENHPVQAVPTLQEAQPQEAAKTHSVNQQEVHTTQQTESVSDAMSLLQALSGGAAASEPDPVMSQKAQEISSETAEAAAEQLAQSLAKSNLEKAQAAFFREKNEELDALLQQQNDKMTELRAELEKTEGEIRLREEQRANDEANRTRIAGEISERED